MSVTWSSSNAQVVTLRGTCLATVKKAGSFIITATMGFDQRFGAATRRNGRGGARLAVSAGLPATVGHP